MKQFINRLAQFRSNESGVTSTEFILVAPVFIMMLFSAVELGVINLRQTTLESRLDSAMRVIRINSHIQYSHDDVRDMMCENAPLLVDCHENLRLEMIPTDPRAYTKLPDEVDCAHHGDDYGTVTNDVRAFTLANANELVMVRACLLYDPIIPTSAVALTRTQDAFGHSAQVAVSAFTAEPR